MLVRAGDPALTETLRPAVLQLGTRARDVPAIVDNLLDLARLEAGAMEPLGTDFAARVARHVRPPTPAA